MTVWIGTSGTIEPMQSEAVEPVGGRIKRRMLPRQDQRGREASRGERVKDGSGLDGFRAGADDRRDVRRTQNCKLQNGAIRRNGLWRDWSVLASSYACLFALAEVIGVCLDFEGDRGRWNQVEIKAVLFAIGDRFFLAVEGETNLRASI